MGPLLHRLAVLAALFLAAGCSHYSLGTGRPAPFRTLQVEPVTNRTLLPQAPALVTARLREAFARDGRTQLADAPADAVLTVTLSGYRREVAAVREGDTGLARKFNVTLDALCTLRVPGTGQVIFENRLIQATREVFTDSGQLQAEYQVLPLLADALAAKVTHASLDVW
jgi:hypothetical protein